MASVLDEVVAVGRVKGGRLFINERRAFDERVARLDEGWMLEVTVRRLRAVRSLACNRYYWGVVVQALSDHTGYTPDEIHDVLKAKFIPKRLAIQDGNGEVVGEFVLGGSTRVMDKQAFGDYLEQIKQWAASELDIYIPDPNEAL